MGAVSGEASVSADQRLHEGVRIQELGYVPVCEVMQREEVSIQASSSLQALAEAARALPHHTVFPVYEDLHLLGTVAVRSLGTIDPRLWPQTLVRDVTK